MLDTDRLIAAGTALAVISEQFRIANAGARELGAALGHHNLAAEVRGFAIGWDDTRASMVDQVSGLAEACGGIGGEFDELDSVIADQLRGMV